MGAHDRHGAGGRTPFVVAGAQLCLGLDAAADAAIVIISARVMLRECLAHCLTAHGAPATCFGSLADWRAAQTGDLEPSIVLFMPERDLVTPAGEAALRELVANAAQRPVIVVAESEGVDQVARALDCGAQGYISGSSSIDVVLRAIELVRAGGCFIPPHALRATMGSVGQARPRASGDRGLTERERAVLGRVQLGAPNKRIAEELNMCPNTVKVHVRHILKKMKAKNRTELAHLAYTGEVDQVSPSAKPAAVDGAKRPMNFG